jgi:hypothetical protein
VCNWWALNKLSTITDDDSFLSTRPRGRVLFNPPASSRCLHQNPAAMDVVDNLHSPRLIYVCAFIMWCAGSGRAAYSPFHSTVLAPRDFDGCMVLVSRIWAHKSKLEQRYTYILSYYYEMYAFRTPWLTNWHHEVKYTRFFFYHRYDMQIKLASQRPRSTASVHCQMFYCTDPWNY